MARELATTPENSVQQVSLPDIEFGLPPLRPGQLEAQAVSTQTINRSLKQNSRLRQVTLGAIESSAQWIHDRVPIPADAFTFGGLALVVKGTLIAEKQNREGGYTAKQRLVPAAMIAAGLLCDAFDGPTARIFERERGHKDPNGAHKDVGADRIQEIFQAAARAETADHFGRTWGRNAALAQMAATSASSTYKGYIESLGYNPNELGRGKLTFLGKRFGRAILNYSATFFPNAQPVLETVELAANVYSTIDQVTFPFEKAPDPETGKMVRVNKRVLPYNERVESRVKSFWLTTISLAGANAAKGLYDFYRGR